MWGEWNIILRVCCDTVTIRDRDDIGWCIAYISHRAIKELVELPVGLLGGCEGVYIFTRMK